MLYNTKLIEGKDVIEGLSAAGLEDLDPVDFGYIYADLVGETFFNDPKEIHRRILSEGGDPIKYFDYFKDNGYTFRG